MQANVDTLYLICSKVNWEMFVKVGKVNSRKYGTLNLFMSSYLKKNVNKICKAAYLKVNDLIPDVHKKVTQTWTNLQFVGKKVKREISERVLQENKARQFSEKTNISYPLTRPLTWAYQGVRNVQFSENLANFFFL